MTSLIYVMRHAQSTVNVEQRLTCKKLEGDLTELGREQVIRAASWLADKNITSIYTSPFHRACQTADIIGEKFGVQPITLDGLREMDCGDFEWQTKEQAEEQWRPIYERWLRADWTAAFPGGETYQQAFQRYSASLSQLLPNETSLLVTHGGITITVLPYLCVNAAALQREKRLSNTGMVVLEPFDNGRYICRSWNLTEHL